LHVVVDKNGVPVKIVLTKGTEADCAVAHDLFPGMATQYVLADRAYDRDKFIETLLSRSVVPVIPSRTNRKVQREYDKEFYKKRHRIENFFLRFRKWRGLATRYCKKIAPFLAAVHIRCLFMATDGV
jgi:transposase